MCFRLFLFWGETMSDNLFKWIVVACLLAIVGLLLVPMVRPAAQYRAFMVPASSIDDSVGVYHAAGWTVDGVSYAPELGSVFVLAHK